MSSGRLASALPLAGSPIRRPAGQRPFAPNRSLSQLAASFIDFLCQGIHRAPLVSSSNKIYVDEYLGLISFAIVICESRFTFLMFSRIDNLVKTMILHFVCHINSLCSSQGARAGAMPVPGEGPGSRMLRSRMARGSRPSTTYESVLIRSREGSVRSTLSDTAWCLPRKEVIQPHLPVRLPCYDFTPLTLHTFGASLTRLGRRLRVQTTRVV